MTDTPHLGHAPIPMRHVGPPPAETESCYDGFKLLEQRGDFYWQVHDGKRTLALALPCQRHRKDDGTAWVFSSWTIDHKEPLRCSMVLGRERGSANSRPFPSRGRHLARLDESRTVGGSVRR